MAIIDISSNNLIKDFSKLKTAGIDAVIIRASLGFGDKDKNLEKNATEISKLGIPVSYYHFAYPSFEPGDAVKEATYFYEITSKLPTPVRRWIDLEDWNSKGLNTKLGKEELVKWVNTFNNTIVKLSGKEIGIYSYAPYLDLHLPANHDLGKFKLWLANYSAKENPKLPIGWSSYYLWQYTCKGSIPGIYGDVDINKINPIYTK